jgi:hypothetical protein
MRNPAGAPAHMRAVTASCSPPPRAGRCAGAPLLRPPFPPAVAGARLPKQLRFHDLRYTCAALLIANVGHMEEMNDHLGHSPIRVTSDRYRHLLRHTRQELADGLDDTYRNAGSAGTAGVRPRDATAASLEHAGPL